MEQLGQGALLVYLISGLIVAVGLALMNQTVLRQMEKSGKIRTNRHRIKYIVLLLLLVVIPIVNTFCVLYGIKLLYKATQPR